jgi:hypothetical protein
MAGRRIIESAYTATMNSKPVAVALAFVFAGSCAGAGYGMIQLFANLPPLAAVIASSSFTGSTYPPIHTKPVYNTVKDELIEAPAPDRDRFAQS